MRSSDYQSFMDSQYLSIVLMQLASPLYLHVCRRQEEYTVHSLTLRHPPPPGIDHLTMELGGGGGSLSAPHTSVTSLGLVGSGLRDNATKTCSNFPLMISGTCLKDDAESARGWN